MRRKMLRSVVIAAIALLSVLVSARGADTLNNTLEHVDSAYADQPATSVSTSSVDKTDVVLRTRNEIDRFIHNFPRRSFGYIELGKVVKPFSSYLDVSITHFKIPESSSYALFEFSAYKRPRNCMQQYPNETVIIYLQHGSTPLIGETFFPLPARVYTQRTQLYRTTMIADQRSHYFKLLSPLPGDWFSVAFLDPMLSHADSPAAASDTSARVMPAEIRSFTQSKRKCNIVVTSTLHMASPRSDSIFDVAFKSVQKSAEQTSDTSEWNKFFPEWSNNRAEYNELILHNGSRADIHGALSQTEARAVYRLPPPDGLFCSVLAELKCTEACRLLFRHAAVPEPDSNSETETLDCAKPNNSATVMPTCALIVSLHAQSASFISIESSNLDTITPYNLSLTKFCCAMPRREVFLSSPSENDAVAENRHLSGGRFAAILQRQQYLCPATYEQLSRVDYGSPFSSRFYIKRSILPFLQDLLFIATHHHRSVQISEFALDPQDSGGTFWLRIDTQSPYAETFASGNVDVQFCLGMRRLPLKLIQTNTDGEPEVWCNAASIIELRVETNGTSKQYVWEVYVPYPEPGPYYLVIVSRLSKNPSTLLKRQKRARNDSGGEVEGGIDELEMVDDDNLSSNSAFVVVQFQAMMQQCFDGATCGRRGRCRLSLLGGSIVTTACECFNGYRGLNCGDAVHAVSDAHITLSIFALTASNVVYIPAAIIAWCRNYRLEALIYVAAASFSTMYHMCDRPPDGSSICVMDYNTLQFADFYAAVLSVWVTLIALAELPYLLLLQLAHIVGSIGIAVAVRHNATALYAFLLPSAVAVVVLLASWLYRKLRTRAFYPSMPYLLLHFVPGICVAVIGLLIFGWLQTEHNYQLVHSVWHVVMGVAIVIILPTRTLRYGKPPKPEEVLLGEFSPVVAGEQNNDAAISDSNTAVAVPAIVMNELLLADSTPLSQCRSSRSYLANTVQSADQSNCERLECVSLVDSYMEHAVVVSEQQQNDAVVKKKNDDATAATRSTPEVTDTSSSSSSSGGCHTTKSSSLPSVAVTPTDNAAV